MVSLTGDTIGGGGGGGISGLISLTSSLTTGSSTLMDLLIGDLTGERGRLAAGDLGDLGWWLMTCLMGVVTTFIGDFTALTKFFVTTFSFLK